MTTYAFAERVRNPESFLDWMDGNIPSDAVMRRQVCDLSRIKMNINEDWSDIRVVLDDKDAAYLLYEFMESEDFKKNVIADKRYFRVSWYPLRPQIT